MPVFEIKVKFFFFSFFQAYHITNDDPIYFWDFLSKILIGLGYAAPRYKIPYTLLFYIALVVQFFCTLLKPLVVIKLTFSPMRVALAGTHHYYSCERAKNDFAYKPLVNMDKAIDLTVQSYAELRKKD